MRAVAVLAAFAAVLESTSGLLVTRGSPCEKNCGNVLDSTHGDDLVCEEDQYGSTSAGSVFQGCTRCEMASNYTADGQTDLQWMAYNVRYAISYCLFGDFGNQAFHETPCVVGPGCGKLKDALEWKNLTTAGGAYDYCQDWDEFQSGKCSDCLVAGDMHYLNNFLVMLNATCIQKPEPGKTISVAGDPFSTRRMNVTTPTPTPLYTYTPDSTAVPVGARVGIAAAGIIAMLAVAGCCVVWNGKRRRRRFLRELEKRHADASGGWPHPGGRRHGSGGDMLETPASQRPLRGWDDTPASQRPLRGWDDTPASAATEASTDPSLGRYFSPYSSTYNSPVSAVDGPAMRNWPTLSPQKLTQVQEDELAYMQAQDDLIRRQQEDQQQQVLSYQQHLQQKHHQQSQQQQQQEQPHPPAFTAWPSTTQEKLAQLQHEREQQQLAPPPEAGIGLALGGDEASLRSKPSNMSNMETASLRSKPSDPQFSSNNPYGGSLAGDLSRPYRTYQNQTTATSTESSSSPAKGKSGSSRDEEEEYEMYEVSPSSGGGSGSSDRSARGGGEIKMPAPPQAPVLHHPGYGRHPSSLRRTGTGGSSRGTVVGGLTEEDARRGNAL